VEFERRLGDRGVVPATYRNLAAQVGDLGPKEASPEFAHAKVAFAKGFVDACKAATEAVGKDLKLKAEHGASDSDVSSAETTKPVPAPEQAAPVYDLRGVACPLNYVKTKLKLEMMDAGERLEVWLDAGEPIKNVPMSLRNDGHTILVQEPLEAEAKHFKILVEKVEA